jgi:hypothetical protein
MGIYIFCIDFICIHAVRVHQFQFEPETRIRFNVMEFEIPGSADNLNVILKEWSKPQMKQFVPGQLFLDHLSL